MHSRLHIGLIWLAMHWRIHTFVGFILFYPVVLSLVLHFWAMVPLLINFANTGQLESWTLKRVIVWKRVRAVVNRLENLLVFPEIHTWVSFVVVANCVIASKVFVSNTSNFFEIIDGWISTYWNTNMKQKVNQEGNFVGDLQWRLFSLRRLHV